MTWYDLELTESGVRQLDQHFGYGPFSIKKPSEFESKAVFHDEGGTVEFMSYNPRRLILYEAVVETFPSEIQAEIFSRLQELPSLEDLFTT